MRLKEELTLYRAVVWEGSKVKNTFLSLQTQRTKFKSPQALPSPPCTKGFSLPSDHR